MRFLLVPVFASLIAMPATARAEVSCADVVSSLRDRIEHDYIGYAMGVAPDAVRLTAYQAFAADAERRAGDVAEADCTFELRRFVDWFDDPHLFVLERPEVTPAEAAMFRAAAERLPVPRPGGPPTTRGVQGAWVTSEFDAIVVPDGPATAGRYVAIVEQSRSADWTAGDVAARFVETDGTVQATLYRTEDRAPVRYRAALERDGQWLHMAPLTWGRRVDPARPGLLPFDPARPRAPVFATLGPDAAIVALPSLSPEYQAEIAALVAAHDADIRARRLLIVDLRGNEGGSPALGRLLAPYYASDRPEPQTGPRIHPRALSSPAMIRYYSSIRDSLPDGSEDRGFIADYVRRMEASPGQVVPYFEDQALAEQLLAPKMPESIHDTPLQVAFLVDRYSVSAAEQLLIEAMRSPRVTTFGENTSGSIDYQNVLMFSLGEDRLHHLLGMPVVGASDELPEKGFNTDGVPVDVSLAGESDWVGVVLRHFDLGR